MKLYWQLAIKYLRYNIRRTVVTLIGVIISATFMFGILNTMFCSLNDERRMVRLQYGYEAIFYDVTKDQLEEMVKGYNVEKYEIKDYKEPLLFNEELQGLEPIVHKDAGWVRFKHPYFMRMDYKKICKEMGLKGELNTTLAQLYDMKGDGDILVVFLAFGLLACYLTGGFAVLVTKNTLRLSVMEKIRDYGVLRCIGTSLKQLKKVVVIEAVLMAVPSAFIGSILGYLVMESMIKLLELNITVTFCFEAFVVMLVALLCSMYFSAIDPCKMIKGITPVMAMNRQLKLPKRERKCSDKQRLAKEKKYQKKMEKRRKKAEKNWTTGKSGFSIYGRLFGIEGEYAYKSMMQNRRKYYGTMLAFSASVIVFIVVVVMGMTAKEYVKLSSDKNAIYNITISSDAPYGIPYNMSLDSDSLYGEIDIATMAQLKKEKAITGCKELRVAEMYESRSKTAGDIYTKEFLTKSDWGRQIARMEKSQDGYLRLVSSFQLAIIEEDDVKEYEKDVLEGTVRPEELSDNGIVLVNEGVYFDSVDDYDMGNGQERRLTITNYQLGDTVTFYDLEELRKEVQKGLDKRREQVESKDDVERGTYWDIVRAAESKLLSQGKIKDYVIEGILRRDRSGHIPDSVGNMILTKESTFYDMTGMDKDKIQGYRLSLNIDASASDVSRVSNLLDSMVLFDEEEEEQTGPSIAGDAMVQAATKETMQKVKLVLVAVLVILFTVSCVNIFNNNASSIFLRKSELAQMRVIGMSKRRLVKMLALEGCIMAAAATIVGSIIGIAISYGLIAMFKVVIGELTYPFPLLGMLIVFIVTVGIMIISTLIPVAGLHNDLVEDMAVEE